jgi:hypothetical protein
VNLYAWDESDPILKTWQKAFPGVVKPKSEMNAELVAHVRYPEDLFKVQRLIYSRYHVSDPAAFYNGQDFWIIPNDPTDRQSNQYQPPYYLTLKMPGQKDTAFSLTTAYSPAKRQTLAAFMAVDSAPGDGYGIFRVLQLPRNTTIPGPVQVQNTFESDPEVASQLSLLRRGGSDVELGNLLLAAGRRRNGSRGAGYVRRPPVAIRCCAKVLVSFGNKVGFEDTLSASLATVFGTAAGTDSTQPDNGAADGNTQPAQHRVGEGVGRTSRGRSTRVRLPCVTVTSPPTERPRSASPRRSRRRRHWPRAQSRQHLRPQPCLPRLPARRRRH